MSTWKRLAERLMRFSGLEAVENPMESEDEIDTTGTGGGGSGEVIHALNAQDPHSPSSGPVMRGAKRSAVDVNGRILPFDNTALGNNSKSAAKLSSNSGAGKGIWYKKADRNALSNSLSYLFENEILTDMVVVVDEKEEIRAHKAILASQSTYLRNLIEEASFKSMNLEEKKNQYFSPESENMNLDDEEEICVIHLKGMSFEVAERIIGFLYSGRIFLTDTNVIDVFLASNMMNISELKQKCEEHVSSFISVDSLQVLLQAARTHNAKELEKRCTSFFQNNAESVLQTESFLEISESILIDLLCKDFYISNELAVFDFVLKWGKTKRRNLALQSKSEGSIPSVQELLINVMKYVRLISIPKSALERKVACSDIVDEELMLEVLFRKLQTGLVYSAGETFDNPAALDSHGKPVKFYLKPRRGTWKKLTDFENESQYSDYMKSVLRQGMLLRAVNSYEQVQQGDVGEFVQFNTGIPPCQVRWQIYGNTYWLFWRDLEIV